MEEKEKRDLYRSGKSDEPEEDKKVKNKEGNIEKGKKATEQKEKKKNG